MNVFTELIKILTNFSLWVIDKLPQLPQLPNSITDAIDSVLNIVFNYSQLIDLFIPLNIVLILLPLSIMVSNLTKIWAVINWIWCHIPIVNSSK